jgi:uncharacterized protein YdeI (YjbR/CyaY-like superfamily)
MIRTERFKKVTVKSALQLRTWLIAHHSQTEGVWLVTFKKHTGAPHIPMEAVLDELVCFGWIDGLRRKLDDDRSMQLISPRRTRRWANTYKERAARLLKENRMHAAGLAEITAAKRAGLWNACDEVDALLIPEDLKRAMVPLAAKNFRTFAPSYRRNVLRWIALAKTAATRAKRIKLTAEFSERNEKLPQM